jgi:hypothetical protein
MIQQLISTRHETHHQFKVTWRKPAIGDKINSTKHTKTLSPIPEEVKAGIEES